MIRFSPGVALAIGALVATSTLPPQAALAQDDSRPAFEVPAVSAPDACDRDIATAVSFLDGTSVTLSAAQVARITSALERPDAPGAETRLRAAVAAVSAGESERVAVAAATFAAFCAPDLASVIGIQTIRARPTAARAIVANLVNVEGVEPNRIAAAIEAAAGLRPEVRQAARDGLAAGDAVAAGPPEQLPGLPEESLRSPVIETAENPARDRLSPAGQ